MTRYFVKLRRGNIVTGFYIRAYDRSQIVDQFASDYFIYSIEKKGI